MSIFFGEKKNVNAKKTESEMDKDAENDLSFIIKR